MSLPLLQALFSLAQFSPQIGKLLSGTPIKTIGDKVIEIAKTIAKTSTEKEAIEKLQKDKDLCLMFQKALLESQKEIEIAIFKDKEQARLRDIAIINSGRKNNRADIMVISAAAGLILCLGTLIIYQDSLPGEAVGIISTISGIFGSCLKDAYNFEFGSSRGSRDKDHTVATILGRSNGSD